MPNPVFVYGTLKRGMANHRWLQQARFVRVTTLPGAWLYDLGPFPMAVLIPPSIAEEDSRAPGTGTGVSGELFAVSGETLEALDRLEGTPRLFERHWLPLALGDWAWVYLGRPHQVRHSPRLACGSWQRPGRADPQTR